MLISLSCQNFYSPHGICVDSEAYSAYPGERAMIIGQNCKVVVLGVERDLVIENQLMDGLKGHKVNIVHLFNYTW